jgi:hypothetical protein
MPAVARTARFVLIAAFAAALVSCTFTKFAYNQADTVMAWLADDYFDLDGQQKADFQKRFDRFYAWHRYEQLPEYAQFMKTARTRMQDGVSREDVTWFVDSLKARTRTAAQKAAPEAAPLLATLTPAQVENLQRKWSKENAKYVRERKVNGTPEERYEAEGKRIVKHLKEWLAPLTSEQEARVIQLARELPQLERERYAERLRRQKEFLEVLNHRNEDLPRFTQRLTDWMAHWERGRGAEYQRQIDASWQKRADLFVAIDKMLTPEQRTASLQRLENYANDFTQLARR